MEQAVQGSGGLTIPGSTEKMCRTEFFQQQVTVISIGQHEWNLTACRWGCELSICANIHTFAQIYTHLPHKMTIGPLAGWKGDIQAGKLILGLCHMSGWVLCCPSRAYQTWFFLLRAVSLKKINVFPPPLQSCFCKCLWCHLFQSELNFFLLSPC